MARESEAGAKSRRASTSNASLDPQRSSMRRLSSRRTVPQNERAVPQNERKPREEVPRLSREGMPRESLRPSLSPRVVEPNAGPKNRRLPQRAKVRAPKGPSLWKRGWLALLAWASALYHGTQRVVTRVSERLDQSPAEQEVEKPVSPALANTLRIVGVLAMVAAGYGLSRFVQHHLTSAPAFAIDAVDIKGLSRLSREELMHAAGVSLGMNVFAKSPEDIHARLLRHPWILSADVRRELPSRLSISVRERDPIALLVVEACAGARSEDEPACDEPSSLYLVSADGKMIKRVSGKEPVDLPVITGITRPRLASDADLSRRVVAQAVSLMQEYRSSDLARRLPIGEIHLEANDGFSLFVGDDLTYVRLGTPPYAQKLSRMKKVFERLEQEHARAEYVYLDNEQRPDRVAVRLR